MELKIKSGLPELSLEEQAKSYSKYYYREPAKIDDELMEVINRRIEMDYKKAITPEKINYMLDPSLIEVENGYCRLPWGGGYIAALHKMPDVTLEMYKWWVDWWTREDLRYKIWCPKYHYKRGFMWNYEDCGCGGEDVFLMSLLRHNPEKIGLDLEKMKKSKVLMADAANATSRLRSCGEEVNPIPAVVTHFVYEKEYGIDIRTRFWKGYQSIGNSLVYILEDGQEVSSESLNALLEHNCMEMATLREILPSLYREESGK